MATGFNNLPWGTHSKADSNCFFFVSMMRLHFRMYVYMYMHLYVDYRVLQRKIQLSQFKSKNKDY